MKIISGYDGCKEKDIMAMPEDELRQAVIRVFSLPYREFADGDSWYGYFLLPDDIADSFRDREVDLAWPAKKQAQEGMGEYMRKVIVSRPVRKKLEVSPFIRYELEPAGEAFFHQFGAGYEELQGGLGNFTTAIVEWPDGRVESVAADHVQFVDAAENEAAGGVPYS